MDKSFLCLLISRTGLIFFLLFFGTGAALLGIDSSAPGTAASHYNSGLAYERLGRLEDAYTELQLACALDSNEARMALALGVVAVRLNRYEVAQRSLERSITLDANSIASYYQLAYLYERQLVTDRAIDSWSRFLELTPEESLKQEARKHLQFLESQRS